ncbi:g4738 [Coccomyxa viridis]|uniref:G4738 protein n=1 Tax=Coccomyxa viridis TaxID=1274662 RepID=A0ABP1FW83_9CHLO
MAPRQLKIYTREEVQKHTKREDAWIILHGKVYNITPHIINHPGWTCGCGTSTVIAIMNSLGTDCSEEFEEVHSPATKAQMTYYCIGTLEEDNEQDKC